MHVGKKKIYIYIIDGHILEDVEEEKDLGVIMNNKFKLGSHCAKVTKQANQVLGLIYRTFSNKNKNIIIKLYKSLVRPHLDYCGQIWRPHLQKDIDLLQTVQKRATIMIPECKELIYKERLRKVGLITLETRGIEQICLKNFKQLTDLNGQMKRTSF